MPRGIDYSGPSGTCNRDPETGIRYGIISLHKLGEFSADSFEAEYDACCPHCQADWPDNAETKFYPASNLDENGEERPRYERRAGYYATCPACEKLVREDDTIGEEPSRHVLKDEGYEGMLDSSQDAWCFKSPFFTRAAFCSPCAPGAVSLSSPCDDGERAYCFGHDWFEGGAAPYPIYSVETGDVVRSPEDLQLEAADDAERREMAECAKLDESSEGDS